MSRVFGDINAVYVPPEHRVDGYVQYISGLQEHVGTFEEIKVLRDRKWVKIADVPEQIPGWPFTKAKTVPRLALNGPRVNTVLTPRYGGYSLLFRHKDVAFAEALEAMPAFIDEMLPFIEATFSPQCIGPIVGVRASEHAYPLPLPPSNDKQFRAGMTWWKVDKRLSDVLPAITVTDERYEQAAAMPLPPNVVRERADPWLTFSWEWDGEVTPEQYAIERGAQHQWYRDALGLALEPTYNNRGDYLTGPGQLSTDSMFTYYQADMGLGAIGTKAMVPEDGALHQEVLRAFTDALKAGTTPDGNQIDRIYIIVPSREFALLTREQAIAAGVQAVLYTAGTGIWDPFPQRPGGWLHEAAPHLGYRGVNR